MAWIQISFTVEEPVAESLSDAFMETGAASVTFSDAEDRPIYEPEIGTTPIWPETKVMALFDAETDPKPVLERLQAQLPALEVEQATIEPLEDKDWVRAWMDQFQPMRFGERLWIVPTWCDIPEPEAVNLILDPGLAFGTGTHPTTALCLQWLDQNAPTNQTVIDYGCGSGVLALAAKKLGATQVSGTDIDPQAIEASQKNATANNLAVSFALVNSFTSEPVDLLIANILAGPLKELEPNFSLLLKPQGVLVLSGLLETQAHEMITFYEGKGYRCTEHHTQDDWAQLTFIKEPLNAHSGTQPPEKA